MKKLILIYGLLWSSFSFGADWIYVTTGGSMNFYIDKSFYKYNTSNKTIDVWTKTTRKKPYEEVYYTSSKTLTRYSCANKESKLLANIEYDVSGGVLSSDTKPSSRFELIFPDSVGETIWVSSCLLKGEGFSFPKIEPEFVDLRKLGYQEQ